MCEERIMYTIYIYIIQYRFSVTHHTIHSENKENNNPFNSYYKCKV